MNIKKLLLCLSFLSILVISYGQNGRFFISINGSYSFPTINTTSNPKLTDHQLTGGIGQGFTAKAKVIQRKRWSYAAGLGIEIEKFDLEVTERLFAPSALGGLGVITGLSIINSNGRVVFITSATDPDATKSFFEDNQLVYLSLIPMEWTIQLIPDKVSVFVNTPIQILLWSSRKHIFWDSLDINNQFQATDDKSEDAFSSVKFGLSGGLNFHFTKYLSVNAAYSHGFTNVYDQTFRNVNVNTNRVALGLSFAF